MEPITERMPGIRSGSGDVAVLSQKAKIELMSNNIGSKDGIYVYHGCNMRRGL